MNNNLNKEKVESSEKSGKQWGNTIEFTKRLGRTLKDEVVKEGWVAIVRTLANVALSGVDFIPGGWGEVADVVGLVSKLSNTKDKEGKKILNLLPNVSTAVLIGANAIEPFFVGSVPSYIIPTMAQFNHDRPIIVKAFMKGKEIMKSEKDDYQKNKIDIDQAVNVFTNK